MFPKRHKPDLPFSVAKKPPKPFAVYCPNPACMKGFDKASKLQKHLSMSTHCGMYMSQLWFKQQLVTEAPTKTQEIVVVTVARLQVLHWWMKTTKKNININYHNHNINIYELDGR